MSRYIIETAKIEHNIETVKQRAGVPVWGIIKFDGYSMGLTYMAGLLRKHGVDRFAVIEPEDVYRLREAGFDEEILFLRPVAEDEEIRLLVEHNATLCISSMAYGERCAEIAESCGKTVKGHLKIDLGLGRYGFVPNEYNAFSKLYRDESALKICGIYSHFPNAFGNRRKTGMQYETFERILRRLETDGIDRGMAHVCNSAALFGYSGMRLDAVRIGSALVGRVAGIDAKREGLERVGRLESRVAEVRNMPSGSRTGYGTGKLIMRNTKIAVVPLGHWDGLADSVSSLVVETKNGPVRAQMIESPSTGHVVLNVTGTSAAAGDLVIADINPLRLNVAVKKVYVD